MTQANKALHIRAAVFLNSTISPPLTRHQVICSHYIIRQEPPVLSAHLPCTKSITDSQLALCSKAMAPTNFPLESEDSDRSLAKMNAAGSLEDSEDMITLEPSTAEKNASNTDSDSSPPPSPSPSRKPAIPRSRAKKVRKAAHQTQKSKPSLRPAKDILSRIRHDPELNESDFIVGYIDRHAPEMMEMDVSTWKGGVADVTDEEWIPQHRIMYFRKKGDEEGRRVWDRATRLDRLFGSGVTPIPALEERRMDPRVPKAKPKEKPEELEVDGVTDDHEDREDSHGISGIVS